MGLRLEMTAVSDGNADAADADTDTACTLTQSNNPSGPPFPAR